MRLVFVRILRIPFILRLKDRPIYDMIKRTNNIIYFEPNRREKMAPKNDIVLI